MTFAEKLIHVSKDDPKFARSVKRMRIASWLFGVGVALAIGIGVWSVAVNYQQDTQITRIESPCLRYGSKSPQCKEAFEAAVATITHPQACAIERKAGTLRAIRELAFSLEITFSEPCAGARIEQERQRGKEREGAVVQGQDASPPASPTSIHAPSVPDQAGHEKGHSEGTSDGTKKPPKSQNPASHGESESAPVDTPSVNQPTPLPTPTAAAQSPSGSEPGNSEETPGAEQGVRACAELIVSACLDAPPVLP